MQAIYIHTNAIVHFTIFLVFITDSLALIWEQLFLGEKDRGEPEDSDAVLPLPQSVAM